MPTKIEWVKNQDGTQGITLNSKTGCLNGCGYCYARKLANGRLKERYLSHQYIPPGNEHFIAGGLTDPFYPRYWPDRLEQIRHRKKPTGIFLDDMSDWMGDYWPEEWTEQELQVMRDCPQHRFYTLTKQPQNLIKWSPFPDNCWVGVTITNNQHYREAIVALAHIEAKVKYLSFEPLLENIKVNIFNDFIQWVIIGGLTGKDRFFPPEDWIQEIEDACNKARIPVFEKNNLRKVWYNYPRQEMPLEGDYADSRRAQKG